MKSVNLLPVGEALDCLNVSKLFAVDRKYPPLNNFKRTLCEERGAFYRVIVREK